MDRLNRTRPTSFNQAFAAKVTDAVGSMTSAYTFSALSLLIDA